MARRASKPKIKCRAPRDEDGRACQRRVSRPGQRCPDHIGRPEVPPGGRMSEYIKRPAKTARQKAAPPTARLRVPRQRTVAAMGQAPRVSPSTRARFVAEAVEICQAAVTSGAIEAVKSRATHYAGEDVWEQLAHHRVGRNCKWLARLARMALDGKDWLHARVGDIAAYLLAKLRAPEIVRLFGAKAAEKIPLPFDEQLIAVARGMQVTGIVICIINGRDLTRCESFLDLVNSEGKQRLKQLIHQAAGDWANLHTITAPSAR